MSVTLHQRANEILARLYDIRPSATRGARSTLALACVESPLGPLLLGAQDGSVATLEFCDVSQIQARAAALQIRFECALRVSIEPVLQCLIEQLSAYFARNLQSFDVPLTYGGSAFQQQVWNELLRIPYGQTCSYGAIAQRIGDLGAMRAVGAANHHNPIAIVIPCHRVVNANGDLGGYGGEVWRKRWLLDLEAGQSQLAF
jgi:AraC family transcriptional regulator of adaptative response/methylated-DNA-[protein]-cysteine methyltransferase